MVLTHRPRWCICIICTMRLRLAGRRHPGDTPGTIPGERRAALAKTETDSEHDSSLRPDARRLR